MSIDTVKTAVGLINILLLQSKSGYGMVSMLEFTKRQDDSHHTRVASSSHLL